MSFFFSVLSLEVIGFFFMLMIVKRRRYPCPIAELASLSYFLGMGFGVYFLMLYHFAGLAFTFAHVVSIPVVMAILTAAYYFSRPERGRELAPEARWKRWNLAEWLLALGVLAQLVWIVFLVIPVPVSSHDAVANYALKAKIFYFAGGIPAGYPAWNEATVAHPGYPPLLPLLMTWVYCFTTFDDLVVKMLMPVIYLAFIVLFYSQMKRFFTRAYAMLAVFLLATIPQLADYATRMYADLILAAFITCAVGYFMLYVREMKSVYMVLAALLMAFSLWVKNEAIVFTGVFAICSIVLCKKTRPSLKQRAFRDTVMALLVMAAIAAPWFFAKLSGGHVNSDIDLARLTPERLWQNVKDIPVMLNLFQQQVFGPKKWNMLWVMVFAGLIWKRKSLWKGECFYLTLFLVLSIAGYFAGYMVTTGENLFFYVNTTLSRFMLHFCGISLFLLAFLVYDDVKQLPSFGE